MLGACGHRDYLCTVQVCSMATYVPASCYSLSGTPDVLCVSLMSMNFCVESAEMVATRCMYKTATILLSTTATRLVVGAVSKRLASAARLTRTCGSDVKCSSRARAGKSLRSAKRMRHFRRVKCWHLTSHRSCSGTASAARKSTGSSPTIAVASAKAQGVDCVLPCVN